MAILRENKPKPIIDLAGPQGNAFALIGAAQDLGKQLRWSAEKVQAVVEDMMSSDYEHLIEVFDQHFGEFIDLLVPNPV